MAFAKKTWVDRLSEFPGRRLLKRISGSADGEMVVDVIRSEGTVSRVGDPYSAANMNDLEQRVADGFEEVNNDLGGCSFETKEDGAYIKYTLPGGADPVLKKLGSGTIRKFVAGQLEYTYRGLYQFSYNLKESYNEYGKITVEDIFGGIHSVSAGSISANVERVGSAIFGDIINYDPETGIINATVNIGTGTNHTIVRVTPCFYIIV